MGKLTSKEISAAVELARANSPDTKRYATLLKEKAPAVEGLLLSALLAEIKSDQLVKSDEQGALRYLAQVNSYNEQVAMMFATVMKNKDKAEMKEIILAVKRHHI